MRCFVNKKSMETEITDRLGDGFSRAPFATVVVHIVSDKPNDRLHFLCVNTMLMLNKFCRLSVLWFLCLLVYLWVNSSFST